MPLTFTSDTNLPGRGTFTYEELTPQLVCNEPRANFIDVAAGKRHSLLVTDDGLVLSTGEGRAEQLGANRIGHRRVVMRRMPKSVLPSGELKRGADYRIVQVQVRAESR
jgi:alpha-tubulin suppressor-like RCC1 family protein